MSEWAGLEIKRESETAVGDRVLIMLLSLNFLLLAFFILMNGLATKEASHARSVLARMREGYDVQGPVGDNTGGAPSVAASRWQAAEKKRLQGVVINRLNLDTVPLETDGERLVMRFPIGVFFNGDKLVNTELVRNLISASGTDALLRWEIAGDMDTDLLGRRAAALARESKQVAMVKGQPEIKLLFIPGNNTKPDVAGTVQRLTIDGGANDVHGEGDAR